MPLPDVQPPPADTGKIELNLHHPKQSRREPFKASYMIDNFLSENKGLISKNNNNDYYKFADDDDADSSQMDSSAVGIS